MKTLTIRVQGTPKGEPRARSAVFRRSNGSMGSRVYKPETAMDWKLQVQTAVEKAVYSLQKPVFTGPVKTVMRFHFPRPKKHFNKHGLRPDAPKHHTTTPDRDNCEKLVLDVLTNCDVWNDDGQSAQGWQEKLYADPGIPAGVTIIISECR
jgi:Holliday junction resolvase RusA-like endonuclease